MNGSSPDPTSLVVGSGDSQASILHTNLENLTQVMYGDPKAEIHYEVNSQMNELRKYLRK